MPPWLAAAWGFTPPARRGPKPAHSVQQIVQVAVELADAEGLGAVSLPRTAQRLGLTPNALYRYINSKEELLILVCDAGWGPPPADLVGHDHWRDAATSWIRAALDGYRARPWLLHIPAHGAPVTTNLLRWLEILLEGLADTGLTDQEMLGCAILLDDHVRSTALLAHELRSNANPSLQSPPVAGFLLQQLRERGYPRLAAIMTGGQYQIAPEGLPETHITFGLDRVLDGIQQFIDDRERRTTVTRRPPASRQTAGPRT